MSREGGNRKEVDRGSRAPRQSQRRMPTLVKLCRRDSEAIMGKSVSTHLLRCNERGIILCQPSGVRSERNHREHDSRRRLGRNASSIALPLEDRAN